MRSVGSGVVGTAEATGVVERLVGARLGLAVGLAVSVTLALLRWRRFAG
jgi:hypothetical protein